jgi:hypothetical protein
MNFSFRLKFFVFSFLAKYIHFHAVLEHLFKKFKPHLDIIFFVAEYFFAHRLTCVVRKVQTGETRVCCHAARCPLTGEAINASTKIVHILFLPCISGGVLASLSCYQ